MKLVYRTLAILAAALVVVAAAYALLQSSAVQTALSSSAGHGGPPQAAVAGADGESGAAARLAGEMGGDHSGANLGAAVEIAKNLGVAGAIVALVSGVSWVGRRISPRRRPGPPNAPPAPRAA